MARIAAPWYWEERNGWFVHKDAQRHFLGSHPAGTPAPKKLKGKWNAPEPIRQAFYALMGFQPVRAVGQPAAPAAQPEPGLTVGTLFEKYLDWCQKNREKRTYTDYVWHLQKFCDHLKAAGRPASTLDAMALRPFHVNEYLDANPDWGQTYRRNAIASVKRAYAWAEGEGHIPGSPVKTLKKPMAARREQVVSADDWVRIRDSYKPGDVFRTFLEFCWECGCRPQEARHIEPRHVHLDKAVIAIPPEEAKGRKKWRLIRLEGRGLDIVRERMGTAKTKLFVNRYGRAWTNFALNCRFHRLKDKLGTRFSPYLFRHAFATRMLTSGVDHLTVAELLGHADGTMLAKVYQHLDQNDAYLREALKKGNAAQSA